MELPLHPDTIRQTKNGHEWTERMAALRRTMADAQQKVPCPDGENHIVLGDYGVIVDAKFVDEVFTRYPDDDSLSDLLTAMFEVGFQGLSAAFDAATAQAREDLNR